MVVDSGGIAGSVGVRAYLYVWLLYTLGGGLRWMLSCEYCVYVVALRVCLRGRRMVSRARLPFSAGVFSRVYVCVHAYTLVRVRVRVLV